MLSNESNQEILLECDEEIALQQGQIEMLEFKIKNLESVYEMAKKVYEQMHL